jgi:hypothetical protein
MFFLNPAPAIIATSLKHQIIWIKADSTYRKPTPQHQRHTRALPAAFLEFSPAAFLPPMVKYDVQTKHWTVSYYCHIPQAPDHLDKS